VKIQKYIKNKYFITTLIFLLYILFLDDSDMFNMYSNIQKKKELVRQNNEMKEKLKANKYALQNLDKLTFLEHYARSKKYFKRADEDIFVIVPNDSNFPKPLK